VPNQGPYILYNFRTFLATFPVPLRFQRYFRRSPRALQPRLPPLEFFEVFYDAKNSPVAPCPSLFLAATRRSFTFLSSLLFLRWIFLPLPGTWSAVVSLTPYLPAPRGLPSFISPFFYLSHSSFCFSPFPPNCLRILKEANSSL